MIRRDGRRQDGRDIHTVRPITSEGGLLPRTHGSALFTRGETQAIAAATLGGKVDAQRTDGIGDNEDRRFYLHYFFPPSSVGETGRVGAANRREIGHGNLAERALMPVIPSDEEFPFVVRLESTITESNGSSSMATVCAGCLALQDAGVPIKRCALRIPLATPTRNLSPPRHRLLARQNSRSARLGSVRSVFPAGFSRRDPVPALDSRRRLRAPDFDARFSGDTPDRLRRCSAGVAEMPGEGRSGGARGDTPAGVSASAPRRALAPLSASEGRRAPPRRLGSLSGCFPDRFQSPSGVLPEGVGSGELGIIR